ncbi:hypothetical protein KM043_012127 [Ampulex compressa]|nr:hypothetical protein KM043_012127 [Ampulex compressa]
MTLMTRPCVRILTLTGLSEKGRQGAEVGRAGPGRAGQGRQGERGGQGGRSGDSRRKDVERRTEVTNVSSRLGKKLRRLRGGAARTEEKAAELIRMRIDVGVDARPGRRRGLEREEGRETERKRGDER